MKKKRKESVDLGFQVLTFILVVKIRQIEKEDKRKNEEKEKKS